MPTLRRTRAAGILVALTAAPLLVAVGPAPAAQASTAPIGAACSAEYDNRIHDVLVKRPAHPRIVLGGADLQRVRELEAASGTSASDLNGMRVRQQLRLADQSLTAPLPTSAGSLAARASFDRIVRLRVAMTLVEDGRSPALADPTSVTPASTYARRIRQEVAAFVAMRSWGSAAPLRTGEDQLLATAEVAAAVALGYSTSGHTMTVAERGAARGALVNKALAPACWGWANGSWMVDARHNWGVVVNAGMAMAGLVVIDTDTRVGAAAVTQSVMRANRAIVAGSSDGGTREGPSYAGLIHTYTAYLSSSLEASMGARGTAIVARVPGAARYVASVTGPSGQLFSYADSNTGRLVPLLPLWNARHGGDALGDWLGAQVLAESHPHPLLWLWSRPPVTSPAQQEPVNLVMPASGIATLRSSWARDATFVGLKAGSNAANHSHLDLGSFVMDAGGHRFVGDPGADSYSLPGYFTPPERYRYWRVATAGHSTFSRRGYAQSPTASAPTSGVIKASGGTRTVAVNMTSATGLRWAQRGVSLAGRDVIVQDKARAAGPTTVRWQIQTQAKVAVASNGRAATLTLGKQVVDVRLPKSTPGVLRAAAATAAPSGGLTTSGWTTLYLDAGTRVGADGVHAVTVAVVLAPR